MAPVTTSLTISVTVIWALPGGGGAQSALHAQVGGAAVVNLAMANTIAGHVGAAHTSSGLAALQPDTVSIERVDIRDLRTLNQPIISGTTGLPSSGTIVGGDMLPKLVALVVTKRTALSGTSFRGRTFVPGFDETASVAGGEASTPARDAAVAWHDDLQTAMTAEGWPLAVRSGVENNVQRDPAISTPITNLVSRLASWGSQRRRRLGT